MSNGDTDKTRLVRRSSSSGADQGSNPPAHQGGSEDTIYAHRPTVQPGFTADGTRIVERGGAQAPPPPPISDVQTVLVRPSSRPSATNVAGPEQTPVTDSFLPEGPVVGWLVVVKGPGKGQSVTLGYGMNAIGRDPDNRVPLPFGDEQISRKKHAVITYDPRGRKYYLQHGDSNNLTYIGDMPVLAPMLLSGGETIRIGGETEIRFVPLCGEGFDWEELN
jgi:hypothetical protein